MDLKKQLLDQICRQQTKLVDWFDSKLQIVSPPLYCSIDLRDSGYKIAPVDCNLYPAGFNNICKEDIQAAPPVFRTQIEFEAKKYSQKFKTNPEVKNILILPENHTSNLFYWDNVASLKLVLENAGFSVRVGWYSEDPQTPKKLEMKTSKGTTLDVFLLQNETPDLILLNNDFSSGYPKLLDELKIPIVPTHRLGWHTRKKSIHFQKYFELAREFAALLEIDPWLIHAETQEVDKVDFSTGNGIDRVAESVESVLRKTKQQYIERKISTDPFVFVKSNSGTYGMGMMVVRSGDELIKLNRREKNKMSVGKNRSIISSVIVQEGVPTQMKINQQPAEPVIYVVGSQLIGGFLRTNVERTHEENLNAKGMSLEPLCMADLKDPAQSFSDCILEHVYGTLAKISALAAGMESL